MNIPIFLSYPKPHTKSQYNFIERLKKGIEERGIVPRTLGVNEYDTESPLKAIRRMMIESNGIITIAFRRTYLESATSRKGAEFQDTKEILCSGNWMTSPWTQIETGMAYQLGLPIVVLREEGVIAEGVLEKGIVGLYMPEFDLSFETDDYLESKEWKNIFEKWQGQVRTVVETKGSPPKLY